MSFEWNGGIMASTTIIASFILLYIYACWCCVPGLTYYILYNAVRITKTAIRYYKEYKLKKLNEEKEGDFEEKMADKIIEEERGISDDDDDVQQPLERKGSDDDETDDSSSMSDDNTV